jgi:hypothetical protein
MIFSLAIVVLATATRAESFLENEPGTLETVLTFVDRDSSDTDKIEDPRTLLNPLFCPPS